MWGVKLYSGDALKTSIPQDIDMNSPAMVRALTKIWELIYKQKVTSPGAMGFSGGKTASSSEYGWTVVSTMQVTSEPGKAWLPPSHGGCATSSTQAFSCSSIVPF